MSKTTNKFAPEVRARAVRMVLERENRELRQAVPASDGADRLLLGITLRDDRGLHFGRPVSPMPRAGENLKTPNPSGASIITWHRHSTSVPPSR